jgi:carboxyl-terminal processing protease
MRDNGGGIVEQALETSSLFLREGQEIASVRSRNQPNEILRSSGRHRADTIPLIVLVDGGSASATEIVAGALQDHDRALVLGTTSFGKGLVQSLYRLDGGYQLKITTGKWFTPSGRSIHRERKLIDGQFVEIHPDSNGDGKDRPAFKSDLGRMVYGGGGIRPDIIVPDDTLATDERTFLLAVASKRQALNTVLQDYALELKSTVTPNFTGARGVVVGGHASSREGRRHHRPEVDRRRHADVDARASEPRDPPGLSAMVRRRRDSSPRIISS